MWPAGTQKEILNLKHTFKIEVLKTLTYVRHEDLITPK